MIDSNPINEGNNTDLSMQTCHTLANIRARKEQLRMDLQKDTARMQQLWDDLFHKPEETVLPSPTQKLMKAMNTGAGIFDGLLLGWKLYRKYGRNIKGRR